MLSTVLCRTLQSVWKLATGSTTSESRCVACSSVPVSCRLYDRQCYQGGKASATWSWPLTSNWCRYQESMDRHIHSPHTSSWRRAQLLLSSATLNVCLLMRASLTSGISVARKQLQFGANTRRGQLLPSSCCVCDRLSGISHSDKFVLKYVNVNLNPGYRATVVTVTVDHLNRSNCCIDHLLQHWNLCVKPTQCLCVSPVRYGLPTQCICVFRTVLTANSDCFPTKH
jgi:hypothetical protein